MTATAVDDRLLDSSPRAPMENRSDSRRFLSDSYGLRPAAIVGLGLLVGLGMLSGMLVLSWSSPGAQGVQTGGNQPFYLNLTIVADSVTGAPRYVPANFTVPQGLVIVTIVDTDSGELWAGCPCNVSGTVGNVETVNGTTEHSVSSADMAHTFSVPELGINVLSPAGTTVTFTLDLTHAGSFTWMCLDPCGQGSDATSTPPMGSPGFMTGTLSVA